MISHINIVRVYLDIVRSPYKRFGVKRNKQLREFKI